MAEAGLLGSSSRSEEKIPAHEDSLHDSDDHDASGTQRYNTSPRTVLSNMGSSPANHDNDEQVHGGYQGRTNLMGFSPPIKCESCSRSFLKGGDLQWHRYNDCERMFCTNDDFEVRIPEFFCSDCQT